MRKLHARYGDRVHFIDVIARQAHPGPGARPYRTRDEKMRDAAAYKDRERLPWPVLVDELDGAVHQVYGALADPSYLIDRDGRVAFYNLWSHVPTLSRALDELLLHGGTGVVLGGVDRAPHFFAAITDGWPALHRGLPQSFTDLELAAPGSATSVWLGYRLKPLLAPIALRARPLPRAARVTFAIGALAVLLAAARASRVAVARSRLPASRG
jgi:hypothetical protein